MPFPSAFLPKKKPKKSQPQEYSCSSPLTPPPLTNLISSPTMTTNATTTTPHKFWLPKKPKAVSYHNLITTPTRWAKKRLQQLRKFSPQTSDFTDLTTTTARQMKYTATYGVKLHAEDACVISKLHSFQIVADGVSGSSKDCGQLTSATLAQALVDGVAEQLCQYELMKPTKRKLMSRMLFSCLVLNGIEQAQLQCHQACQGMDGLEKRKVSSTLSVAYLDKRTGIMYTFNVGDSKTILIRQGKIIEETMSILREFNSPSVISVYADQQMMTQVQENDYVVQAFQTEKMDLCLTFSDGVGDNLYKDDYLELINQWNYQCNVNLLKEEDDVPATPEQEEVNPLDELARLIVDRALEDENKERDCMFPFTTAAVREYHARAVGDYEEYVEREDPKTSMLKYVSQEKKKLQDHVECARELKVKHQNKCLVDRHALMRNKNRKKYHYSLKQMQALSLLDRKKKDDTTICISLLG